MTDHFIHRELKSSELILKKKEHQKIEMACSLA